MIWYTIYPFNFNLGFIYELNNNNNHNHDYDEDVKDEEIDERNKVKVSDKEATTSRLCVCLSSQNTNYYLCKLVYALIMDMRMPKNLPQVC